MELQQVQLVVPKSEAEIAAEKAAAELLAFQQEAGELLKVCEEEVDWDSRDDRDYTHTIELRGDKWLFTFEGASRKTLLGSLPADLVLSVNLDGLENHYVGVNVDALFKSKREILVQFAFSAASSGDSDVTYMMNTLFKMGEFKVEWPTGEQSITNRELMLLLLHCKNNQNLMKVEGTNQLARITNVSFRPANPFSPEHIALDLESTLSMGKGMIQASTSRSLFGAKFTFDELEVTIADQACIDTAVAQGKELFQKLSGENDSGFSHVTFNGVAYTPGFFGSRVPHTVTSRVVIDPEGLRQVDQSKLYSMLRLFGIHMRTDHHDNVQKITEFKPEHYAMLCRVAVFFNLSRSMWMVGTTENLQAIKFRENAFDRLVLSQQRKRMVQALVTQMAAENNCDLIEGKGGGAIFLLDGPPGTGKTLTAEATAEKLQSVLYKVSLGELGTDPGELESSLTQILSVASRWNSVLLLDEADIFLEKRSTENLQRNALVAVFLRLMEYYTGILFLTTNRGDNFDQAVLSRVTLAMHFRKPDATGRRVIWSNLLSNAEIKINDRDMALLAELDLNGREIKNAINSSMALAKVDGTAVQYSHLREIVDAQTQFGTE